MPLPIVGMCCTSIETLQVTEKSYSKHDGTHCNTKTEQCLAPKLRGGGVGGGELAANWFVKTWPCCHLQPLQGCKHITISSKGPLSSTREPLSSESASDGPLKALIEISSRKMWIFCCIRIKKKTRKDVMNKSDGFFFPGKQSLNV